MWWRARSIGATIGEAAALTSRAVQRRRDRRRELVDIRDVDADTGAAQPGGFQRWMPGIPMLRSYRRSWLRFDLVAGLVLAAILVPQGMAYAELAGLPAVTGLYTTIACLIGYAIFGPSRILVLGPDSSVAPLIFAAIARCS